MPGCNSLNKKGHLLQLNFELEISYSVGVKLYFFNENSLSVAFHLIIWEKNRCFRWENITYLVKNSAFCGEKS